MLSSASPVCRSGVDLRLGFRSHLQGSEARAPPRRWASRGVAGGRGGWGGRRAGRVGLQPGVHAEQQQGGGEGGRPAQDAWWRKRMSKRGNASVAQRAVSGILSLPGVPIGSYVAEPVTPLHRVDARIKQAWLLALLLLPVRASLPVRCGVDLFLLTTAVVTLPKPVWKPQLTQVGALCALVFFFTAIGSDSIPTITQDRLPGPEMEGLLPLPSPEVAYQYVLLKFGPIQVTRRSATLAGNAATLSFSILQSAHLCLSTTTPEALAYSLRWYLWPLKTVGVPVEELVLTTLLSLRFLSLVFEELRGLVVGLASRGLQWDTMKPMDLLEVAFGVFRRLQSKLILHAEDISEAMVARGFESADKHNTLLELEPGQNSVLMNIASTSALVGLTGWIVVYGDSF